MTGSVTMLILIAVMYACGVYVLLERSLTRVLIGFLLVGNATNLLLLFMSGGPGDAPIVGEGFDPATMSDPLPQALILTAIVINFGVTAFLLALIYRSWWLGKLGAKGDEVSTQESVESTEASESVFETAAEEDQAIQDVLESSDEAAEHDEARISTGSIATQREGGDRP